MKLTPRGAYRKLQHAWNHLIRLHQRHWVEAGHPHAWGCDCADCLRLFDDCLDCKTDLHATWVILDAENKLAPLAYGQGVTAPA